MPIDMYNVLVSYGTFNLHIEGIQCFGEKLVEINNWEGCILGVH